MKFTVGSPEFVALRTRARMLGRKTLIYDGEVASLEYPKL